LGFEGSTMRGARRISGIAYVGGNIVPLAHRDLEPLNERSALFCGLLPFPDPTWDESGKFRVE
jgi:hypothetical protein